MKQKFKNLKNWWLFVKFFGTILCTQVPKLINWTLLENNENCLPLRAYLAKTCAISLPSLLTLLPHPNFFRKILTSSTIWPMSLLDSKWCWTICSVLPVYSCCKASSVWLSHERIWCSYDYVEAMIVTYSCFNIVSSLFNG